ncbi:prolipoprotein diacylglyceryl transferase family protein [Sporosalibacterium faouarense]|uniref:prolipoprotein diacylglyceryl transferase family protein n=1 Tax=Sporosalibacterium faouarense TaxID=516123 RepID=UPI00141D15B2|nr:prolipoprotein diacylglyceryl transferase family protein [Sporosalibacterium faouarense]MTI48840.1 prolipoprotein diacylglyceryl transferase [Bacillota bacterium]
MKLRINPYIFIYKSIGITWFVFFTVLSIILSYLIIKKRAKHTTISQQRVEDTFFLIILVGFIGARITYVLINLNVYMDSLSYVFKLSHYNLSLGGGVLFGLFTIWFVSKMQNISFQELLKIFTPPFYISMAIGIWTMLFDGVMIGEEYSGIFSFNYLGGNRHLVTLYLTLLFIVSLILELKKIKKISYKFRSLLILIVTILLYYLIKNIFTL